MNNPQLSADSDSLAIGGAELPLLMPGKGRAGGVIKRACDVLELRLQGPGVSTIARQTRLDRKTVWKYPERGLETLVYGRREPSERMAMQFQSYLCQRLEAFPGLSARRCHREIKAMGCNGAYPTLPEYLRLIRPSVPLQFLRRLETAAVQQAQMDFARFQVAFPFKPAVLRKV